jgi:hypothetical protein
VEALTRLVWQRARHRCEYCRMPAGYDESPFEIDHIISKKHHGRTVSNNLALSCFCCNSFKGSDIAGRDSLTGILTQLFNPRRHSWHRHFRWDGAYLVGKTAIGRATVDLLRINELPRVELREELIEEGLFP